jgi:hypothetical protein
MKSLDLNRRYYHACVAPILDAHASDVAQAHAAALLGWGSEVLGNDDTLSRTYGWEPRLLLILPNVAYQAQADRLRERLQREVPPTFLGHPTRFTDPTSGPPQPTLDSAGQLQITITTCDRLVARYLGLTDVELPTPKLSARDWLGLPEAGLLRLTAGEVYADHVGDLTALREALGYYPGDVWRFRLAYRWTTLSWDVDLIGLCAERGDALSARLALARSVERIISLVFLLNKTYQPGYLKWTSRQFNKLPELAAELGPTLDEVLTLTDPAAALDPLYTVIDTLVAHQRRVADLPEVAYHHPPHLDRGFFKRDLQPIIAALRATLAGELATLAFPIGAVDQWVADQDLRMAPTHLRALAAVYDREEPFAALLSRSQAEAFL